MCTVIWQLNQAVFEIFPGSYQAHNTCISSFRSGFHILSCILNSKKPCFRYEYPDSCILHRSDSRESLPLGLLLLKSAYSVTKLALAVIFSYDLNQRKIWFLSQCSGFVWLIYPIHSALPAVLWFGITIIIKLWNYYIKRSLITQKTRGFRRFYEEISQKSDCSACYLYCCVFM